MTWMGNGNECDYKLKFSDTSKVIPTIVFKSFLGDHYRNWDNSEVFTLKTNLAKFYFM